MKKISEKNYQLLELFDRFIAETVKGKRLQKNGKRIRSSSTNNLLHARKLLAEFAIKKSFELRIRSVSLLRKREFEKEKKYWNLAKRSHKFK